MTTTTTKKTASSTKKDDMKTAESIKAAQENLQKAVEAGKENLEKAVKASTETVQKNLEKSVEMSKKQFEEISKGYDEAVAFNKENYEAAVAAGTAAVKAFETLNGEWLAASKKAVESNVEAMKNLFSAKTPAEFFEIQSGLMKERYDEIVAESTRLNEVVTKAGKEVAEPLKARYEAIAEKFNLPLAS
ncbi:phasin family protein [Luteithermobacter gelatinilyticus]|uniref:phasin family protein n=1 Tax=Luteithermobacter gelatinilyticus TaxID=2582913 RepID=UPI001FEC9303|nr:phasin family protein [Luteithermobacter gelatinilyticus]